MRLTPVSALLYNLSPANLSIHGTHPFYQHFLVNLPILALPALPLLLSKPNPSIRLFSALSATVILSFFSHQEARFLLPCIPLILSSISLPASKRHRRVFIGAWILFNAFAGVLMGIYHQGGVIPMQIHLGRQTDLFGVREVLWWKTYSPPVWLLDGKSGVNNSSLQTIDLMGMPVGQLMALVQAKCGSRDIIVVAPRSRTDLDPWTGGSKDGFEWKEVWTEWRHLNLDDLDWGEEGLVRTLKKIVSGRGLTAWIVRRG
ncbi:alpha 1,2 mannosyltransferase [Varicellaria rhodocarpa]|nr:alpha 1,2 mannosyltransferase [Varicellaria rhodocarpa]